MLSTYAQAQLDPHHAASLSNRKTVAQLSSPLHQPLPERDGSLQRKNNSWLPKNVIQKGWKSPGSPGSQQHPVCGGPTTPCRPPVSKWTILYGLKWSPNIVHQLMKRSPARRTAIKLPGSVSRMHSWAQIGKRWDTSSASLACKKMHIPNFEVVFSD